MLRILMVALFLLAEAAFANEAAIRKSVEPKLSGGRIEGVQATPVAGLWEVRVRGPGGMQIFYTDSTICSGEKAPLVPIHKFSPMPGRARRSECWKAPLAASCCA